MANNFRAGLDNHIVQHTHRIEKIIAVTKLIAQTKERDLFAGEIYCGYIIPKLFPVGLDLAEIPRGNAEDDLVVVGKIQLGYVGDIAHIETDECGAPEFFSNGSKLLVARTEQGKLTPAAIREIALKRKDIHYPKPRVVSLTQATEIGTVYQPDELRAISDTCKELGLHLHMDGARFANACAFLGLSPAELSWKTGVDVLCFGGTKNGMAVGEAILFFNRDLAEDFEYRCKQAGQLASKMRFLSAPWVGLLEGGAWMKYAKHANSCAQLLAGLIDDVPGVELMFPVQANGVFVSIPPLALEALRSRGWMFYTFIGVGGARFMCSWDTSEERVRQLADDIRSVVMEH